MKEIKNYHSHWISTGVHKSSPTSKLASTSRAQLIPFSFVHKTIKCGLKWIGAVILYRDDTSQIPFFSPLKFIHWPMNYVCKKGNADYLQVIINVRKDLSNNMPPLLAIEDLGMQICNILLCCNVSCQGLSHCNRFPCSMMAQRIAFLFQGKLRLLSIMVYQYIIAINVGGSEMGYLVMQSFYHSIIQSRGH